MNGAPDLPPEPPICRRMPMNSIATQVVETAAATAEQAASPAAVEMSVDDLDMAGRGYAVGIIG